MPFAPKEDSVRAAIRSTRDGENFAAGKTKMVILTFVFIIRKIKKPQILVYCMAYMELK